MTAGLQFQPVMHSKRLRRSLYSIRARFLAPRASQILSVLMHSVLPIVKQRTLAPRNHASVVCRLDGAKQANKTQPPECGSLQCTGSGPAAQEGHWYRFKFFHLRLSCGPDREGGFLLWKGNASRLACMGGDICRPRILLVQGFSSLQKLCIMCCPLRVTAHL